MQMDHLVFMFDKEILNIYADHTAILEHFNIKE